MNFKKFMEEFLLLNSLNYNQDFKFIIRKKYSRNQ